MRRTTLPPILLPALFAAACAAADSASDVAIRDSAGVRIVEYVGEPAPAASLRLSAEPLWRAGHRPGGHLFARVQAGALRPSGGAVVVDVGTGPGAPQEVLDLAPDGSLRAVLARGGQGPEEVRSVLTIEVFGGDSVLVEDRGNAKLLVFAGTTLARSVGLAANPELARGLRVLGIDADGRLLITSGGGTGSGSADGWTRGGLARLDQEALRADTVASYQMAPALPQGPGAPRNPFMAFGVAAASGGGFVTFRTDTPEIFWLGADGALRQILRWNPEPARPTPADVERYIESMKTDLARVNPMADEATLERIISQQVASLEIPPDAVLPLTRAIHGDESGRVWISEFVPVSGGYAYYPPSYTVVDADGTWLGTLQVPERFRLLDVSGNRVLGVELDALDVESVVVYELEIEPRGG